MAQQDLLSTSMKIKKSLVDRFWSFVIKRDGCWSWSGAKKEGGYGLLGRGDKRGSVIKATHVSWKIHFGRFPLSGEWVLHKCDNPECTNPGHLYLGSPKENTRDAWERGRASPPPIAYGTDNFLGKLTDTQILEIRQLGMNPPSRRNGRVQFWKKIADQFGVSGKHVREICNNNRRNLI